MPPHFMSESTERHATIAILILLSLACGAWFVLWVQPRDAFLNEVLDCAGPNPTQQAFIACEAKVAGR